MQSVAQQLGVSDIQVFRPHTALVCSDALGVELELEGFNATDTNTAQRHLAPLWAVHGDGSLRNGGVEFVTNGGLGGDQLYAAFERITTCLADRVEYDASWRCSTHMHVNMLDFTLNQVARFVMVYAACEPLLFAHAGQFRRSSNFCTPVAESIPFHKKLISRLYDDACLSRGAAQSCNKYTALNLLPLFGDGRTRALGTVEFRGGRPMTTMSDLLLQANLLLAIKLFVRNHKGTDDELLASIQEGVRATVYAQGVGSELQVDGGQLDEAMVHAWVLLKSYQNGMKNKPTKSQMRSEDMDQVFAALRAREEAGRLTTSAGRAARAAQTYRTAAWETHTDPRPLGEDPTVELSLAQQMDRLGHYSSSYRQQEDVGVPSRASQIATNNEWPLLHHYWPQMNDPAIARPMKANFMRHVLRDIVLDVNGTRLTQENADRAALHWLLRDETAGGIRGRGDASPCRAIWRAHINRSGRNAVESVSEQIPPSRQPMVLWPSQMDVGYRSRLPIGVMDRVCQLLAISPAASNYSIFNKLLITKVRVRELESLRVACAAIGIDISRDLSIYNNNLLPVVLLRYLLHWIDRSSETHVHSNDLGYYDRYAEVIDILTGAGLTIPVLKFRITPGNEPGTFLRMERHSVSSLGYGISDRIVSRQRSTETRTTASGHIVY